MSSLALSPEPEPQSQPDPPAPLPREPFLSGPVAGIIMGNAVTFAGAVFRHWPALPIMVIYWGQSVAVGIATIIRMLRLKEFSTAGFTSGNRPVPATRAGQVSTARFFAFHYGCFHLVYALFLFRGGTGHGMDGMGMMVAGNIALFAGSHVWHAMAQSGEDYRGKPNLGVLMFYPYLRVLPMHLAIILGGAFPLGMLPVFILLKTGADLGMHEVERRMLRTATD